MMIASLSALVLKILLLLTAFGLHYLTSAMLARRISNSLHYVVIQRLVSAALITVPVVMFATYDPVIVHYSDLSATLLFSVILSAAAIAINSLRRRNALDSAMYPHIRLQAWTPRIVILNAITWMIYLLPYEFALRGSLLTNTLSYFDVWPAFIVNAIVYAIAHLPQGKRETLSAFPFGILLCLVTYFTGNFWSAFIIHSALAISNDFFAVRNNPTMHFTTPLLDTQWRTIKKTLL
jgi:membrane protease YdiL (CAAX protease family)